MRNSLLQNVYDVRVRFNYSPQLNIGGLKNTINLTKTKLISTPISNNYYVFCNERIQLNFSKIYYWHVIPKLNNNLETHGRTQYRGGGGRGDSCNPRTNDVSDTV